MAWLAYNAENDGVGCDERPEEVAAIFDDTVGTWAKLHDRGKPMFVDPRAVYWICPDDEEIEKDTNLTFMGMVSRNVAEKPETVWGVPLEVRS